MFTAETYPGQEKLFDVRPETNHTRHGQRGDKQVAQLVAQEGEDVRRLALKQANKPNSIVINQLHSVPIQSIINPLPSNSAPLLLSLMHIQSQK